MNGSPGWEWGRSAGCILWPQKAFDSVPHCILIDKLYQLEIPSHLIRSISNYLHNLVQQVGVLGELSSPTVVISGVPRGSVLGLLLFLIYIEGLSGIQLSSGSIVLFADDLLLHQLITLLKIFNMFKTILMIFVIGYHPTSCHWMQTNASPCSFPIGALESVQRFTAKICTKSWNTNHQYHLGKLCLQTLNMRRSYLKQCHLYKLVYGLSIFPNSPITTSSSHSYPTRSNHNLSLHVPSCHTNADHCSLVPFLVMPYV